MLASALLPACGLASRDVFLAGDFDEVSRARGDAAPLRSIDPAQPGLWLYDAQRLARAGDLEGALALLERGHAFRPDDPNLLGARIEVLARLGRRDEALLLADAALASFPPTPIEPALRFQRVVLLVAQERLDEATDEARRLGGTPFVPPDFVGEAWCRIALAREALGRPADADAAFDRALAAGPFGATVLVPIASERPEHAAAAAALLSRAAERHPRHPDVLLEHAVVAFGRGDFAEVIARLEALPQPLPSRLSGKVGLIRAQASIESGDVDDGVARLLAHLEQSPADYGALFMLADAWRSTGRPPVEVVREHVLRARHRAPDDVLAELDALLDALEDPPPPGDDAGPSPPPDAGAGAAPTGTSG